MTYRVIKLKNHPLSNDLDYILDEAFPLWETLRDQRIFITGGTGFFGCWLLESFAWANKKLNLNARAVVLTRNTVQFQKKCPHLFLDSSLTFHEGDVRNFRFPLGNFSHVIHAATEASVALNVNQPELMFDTIVQGTKHTLNFARQCGASNVLITSSGAIYGKQPSDITHIFETSYDNAFIIDDAQSAYANGKRKAEQICAHYAEKYKLNIKIARCFAFVGPYMPLDTHFAIGNFIRNGLNGQTIVVKGDGTPSRSYLYAADLVIWLWTILFKGATMRPYNVGSDESLTIKELAFLMLDVFDSQVGLKIEQPPSSRPTERYVPDISRARNELNLVPKITLKQAIQSTKKWYSQ